MQVKQRSTLIKGRILASVITFLLLFIFLFVAARFGLIGGREDDEGTGNGDNLENQETSTGFLEIENILVC